MALCSGPKTQAELARETKIKNVYQIMSSLIKSGEVIKQDKKVLLRDSLNPQYTKEHKIAHYKYLAGISKFPAKDPSAYIRNPQLDETKATPQQVAKPEIVPNEHVDRIAMLKDEIDNIDAGIRALYITKSYLLRRCQEESANA